MSADLYIHVFSEGELTEDDFRDFFSHCLGSKWCDPTRKSSSILDAKINNTERCWIGSVSWAKAAILNDPAEFIPESVDRVNEIIGEDWPIIDDGLINKIAEAMVVKNATGYEIATAVDVIEFLKQHVGKRAFTISW